MGSVEVRSTESAARESTREVFVRVDIWDVAREVMASGMIRPSNGWREVCDTLVKCSMTHL